MHTLPNRLICATVLLSLLAACSPTPPPAQESHFEAVTDIKQTMSLIIDPVTDVIWGSAGTIITADGQRELTPTTDAGWLAVEQAAAVLTESSNLLLLPGRVQGDDWVAYSIGLREAGKLAMQAAQARDADALFDAGGALYQVCLACHTQYLIEEDAGSE